MVKEESTESKSKITPEPGALHTIATAYRNAFMNLNKLVSEI